MLNVTCHAWLSWIRNFWKVSYHSMLRRVIIMITTNVFHVKFSPNNFGLHMQGRYGKCATHFLLISLQSYLTSKENWASAYFYLHYTLPSGFFSTIFRKLKAKYLPKFWVTVAWSRFCARDLLCLCSKFLKKWIKWEKSAQNMLELDQKIGLIS